MRRLFTSATIATLVLSLAFAAGCGGATSSEGTTAEAADHHADQATPDSTAALVPWKDAVMGDRTTCPVSNEEFVVSAESPKVEHEGHTYYFCCAGCIERFEANPAQYIGGGT